jgi:hypothetical protein
MVGAKNQVYFLNNGLLWSSGGTSNTTNSVNDKGLNNVCCYANMTMVGDQLAFTGYSQSFGGEIWMGNANCRSTQEEDNAASNMIKPTEESDVSTAIYPNPANNMLNVRVSPSLEGRLTIIVVDANGASLIAKTLGAGETTTQFNVASLPSGVYFVKIISANGGESVIKKFVKM